MTKSRDIAERGATGNGVPASASEIEAFLAKAAAVSPAARGRLIFALDATMSRQPTWDLACKLQAAMFEAAAGIGGLSVQLAYFRGLGECRASAFVADGSALADLMVRIACRGGQTQIGKLLSHVRREAEKQPVAALIYVGDAMEENPDELCRRAGEIGLLGTRAFMFHEGRDGAAESTFREIARLTGGAYLPFDRSSAAELRALLKAVATYAAGGLKALEAHGGEGAQLLLARLPR
jgi:hypothetical protein